jgi:AraC-like DNA-binding protein
MAYFEQVNPERGLDGLFECFEQQVLGAQNVVDAHIHEHFEVLYCTSGQFELIIENQTMLLSSGDFVLIRPMRLHQTRTLRAEDNRYIVLKFVPDGLFSSTQPIYEMKYIFPFIHAFKQGFEYYHGKQLRDHPMKALLQNILRESTQRLYGYEMATRANIEQLLLWFIRQWHSRNNTAAMDEQELKVIKGVFQYIETHFDEPLSVDGIAQSCNMGRSTFSRFFNHYVGESLPAYIRRVRLTNATNLLLETRKPVTDIAMEAGFSSTSYFVMCFHKQNNITPKQFRKISAGQR